MKFEEKLFDLQKPALGYTLFPPRHTANSDGQAWHLLCFVGFSKRYEFCGHSTHLKGFKLFRLLSLIGDFFSWEALADLYRNVNGIQREG
jgi:hypothetical protein